MKAPNSKQWGHTGQVLKLNTRLRIGKRGKVLGTLQNTIPNNGSDVKYARTHLNEQEYKYRMRKYIKRAKARLSLFDNSRKVNPERKSGIIVCAGCDIQSPKRSYISKIGWHVETVLWYGESIGRLTICLCPKCYKEEQDARARKSRNEVYQ